MEKSRLFGILRVAFGTVWAIDACFKWNPDFLNGLGAMLAPMAAGHQVLIADWIGLAIRIVSLNPHLFAMGIALAESALAVGLILDIFPRTILVTGFFFSLLLWSIGEGFGGPYSSASTDVGAAVIYSFVFAALYFERFGKNEIEKKEKSGADAPPSRSTPKNIAVRSLSLAVIVLAALLVSPYFIVHTNSEPSAGMTMDAGDNPSIAGTMMSSGMVMKTFDLSGTGSTTTDLISSAPVSPFPPVPIPTVRFELMKDTLDGWDLHVITTNFTFTPQNINQAPVADQGHVHLYIDGTLYVVFGPWYHIDGALLPPGKHVVAVSLNANDHSIFAYDGRYIESSQTVYVSPI